MHVYMYAFVFKIGIFFFTKGHKKYMHLFYGRYYLRFFIINLMCNMCVSILLLTLH